MEDQTGLTRQERALALGARHAPLAPLPAVSGPIIPAQARIAAVSALSDPWHSGRIASPADRLMAHGGGSHGHHGGLPSGAGSVGGGPLEGLGGSLGEVLSEVGHGWTGAHSSAGSGGAGHWSQYAEADPPAQGIHEGLDGSLLHFRRNTDGSATAAPVGSQPPSSVAGPGPQEEP